MKTIFRSQHLVHLILALLIFVAVPTAAQEAGAPSLPASKDVRIVVDISGSMKDSDPQNLRQPAVRLLARMLPGDARSGVWTFGQYVNMLVPSGEVTPRWREIAVERSGKINSIALRTNIGEALEVASDDFYGDRRFDNTHFILLTDGVVDIAPSAVTNARERNRILDDVVERIRSRGATIHTIALSENADLALLERLAVKTGGTFAVASDADALNRVFAETLNTAAPQPEVPIRDNGFTVSDDVEEFTALIFHEAGESPLALVPPNGQRIEAKSTPENVRWYEEGEYDLITVTEPAAGEWQIDGQLGEQSKVTVVSDLRMAVSPIPSFFYTGQPVSVEAAFYEEDSRVTDPDFLDVLDVSLTLKTEDGRSGTKPLSGETPPSDGVYTDTIEKLSEPGAYDLTLVADGKTFARQFSSRITLRPPVNIEVKAEGQGADARYIVEVRPEHPELDRQESTVGIQVESPDQSGEPAYEAVAFDEAANVWRANITPSAGDGKYPVKLRFRGQTDSGLALSYAPAPFVAEFPRPDAGQTAYTSLSAPTVTDVQPVATAEEVPEPAGQEPLLAADKPAVAPGSEPEAAPPASEPQPTEEPVTSPETAAEEGIESPIDVSQVETPTKPVEEPAAAEEGSFWEQIPIWVWATLGGVVVLAAGVIAVLRSRRKNNESSEGSEEVETTASDDAEEAEDVVPPVVEPAEDTESEAEEPLAEMEAPVEDEAAEPESEPPVAEVEEPPVEVPEEVETAAPVSEDVPVLDETEAELENTEVIDDTAGIDEWPDQEQPDEVEPPIASTEVAGEEDLAGADETADEIERFLAEARQDETDLDIENEDILAEPESPATAEPEPLATESAEEDEHMLEDFDLSDIDDLPDLDEEPDEKSSKGGSERKE